MVEIEGERVLAASCIRKPAPDMVVKTATDRAVKARRMVMELLLADQPPHEDLPDRVSPFLALGRGPAHRDLALSGPWHPQARPVAPSDGGQSRCLHRLRAMRARLPGSSGQ